MNDSSKRFLQRQQMRQRILEAAGRVLRREGYAAAGVDALAAEAGVTSGAIYSHFKGKRDLLTYAVEAAVHASEDVREQGLERLHGRDWVAAMLRRYLSPEHHEAVEAGCPIPSLISELSRAGEEPQAAFSRGLEQVIQRMQQKWSEPADPCDDPRTDEAAQTDAEPGASETGASEPGTAHAAPLRQQAIAALAMAVGGMSLARALGRHELAQEVLQACRDQGVESLVVDQPRPPHEDADHHPNQGDRNQ
jgi:TetR/AcrR family transcriptional repressor of nem operon